MRRGGVVVSAWETAGQSDEWYTPRYIFEALGCNYECMGAGLYFDLDVAPAKFGRGVVPTHRMLVDSLSPHSLWFGFVWMNPPFGGRNAIVPWLDKFFAHGDGIALTPDRTSAPWFHDAWRKADAVMFLPKVKFVRPDGSLGASPSTGTALWAIGERGHRALQTATANGLGILAKPLPVPTVPPSRHSTRPGAACHPQARTQQPSVMSAPGEGDLL